MLHWCRCPHTTVIQGRPPDQWGILNLIPIGWPSQNLAGQVRNLQTSSVMGESSLLTLLLSFLNGPLPVFRPASNVSGWVRSQDDHTADCWAGLRWAGAGQLLARPHTAKQVAVRAYYWLYKYNHAICCEHGLGTAMRCSRSCCRYSGPAPEIQPIIDTYQQFIEYQYTLRRVKLNKGKS